MYDFKRQNQIVFCYTEINEPSQESQRSCMSVVGVSFLPLYFIIRFWKCFNSGVFFVFHCLTPPLLTLMQ